MGEQNARERILQAAIKVFAEKSFEGSRINDIAEEANVPKSLIYYHFRSKDEILEVLTSRLIDEYSAILAAVPQEDHQKKAPELALRMKNVYYEFGQKNADLIRAIFIDSLKKSKENPVFYKILDALISRETEDGTKEDYEIQERRIAEFFTSFIPNYAYLCFADSWVKYFQMDRRQFDELFLKVYEETHGAYHKNHK